MVYRNPSSVSGSRKLLNANSELRIIENQGHSVNFAVDDENPSLQSFQTTYRSMQSVAEPNHAQSLQSMHSAQASFERSSSPQDQHHREASAYMNYGGQNGASMQSLRHQPSQDDYSPQNTIRLRKISQTACSNPPQQSVSKLSVNSSCSKPATPTTELSRPLLPGSTSQQSNRLHNVQAPTFPPVSSKCQNPPTHHQSHQQQYQPLQQQPHQSLQQQPSKPSSQHQQHTGHQQLNGQQTPLNSAGQSDLPVNAQPQVRFQAPAAAVESGAQFAKQVTSPQEPAGQAKPVKQSSSQVQSKPASTKVVK